MFVSLRSQQPLPHREGLPNNGRELKLVVHLFGRADDDFRGGSIFVLANRPLNVSARDDDGRGAALVAYGEVEEGGRGVGVLGDDTARILDVLEGAGEIWPVSMVCKD